MSLKKLSALKWAKKLKVDPGPVALVSAVMAMEQNEERLHAMSDLLTVPAMVGVTCLHCHACCTCGTLRVPGPGNPMIHVCRSSSCYLAAYGL